MTFFSLYTHDRLIYILVMKNAQFRRVNVQDIAGVYVGTVLMREQCMGSSSENGTRARASKCTTHFLSLYAVLMLAILLGSLHAPRAL